MWRLLTVRALALLLVVLVCRGGSFAYSVLTHEEIVVLVWSDEIRPLLLKRYPGLSEDQIKEAHAYAYGGAVAFLHAVGADSALFPNCDLDSGQATKAAEYSLADETYAKLLGQLSSRKFDGTTPELRANILDFYSDLSVPVETKKDHDRWQGILTALDQLKSVAPVRTVAASPAP